MNDSNRKLLDIDGTITESILRIIYPTLRIVHPIRRSIENINDCYVIADGKWVSASTNAITTAPVLEINDSIIRLHYRGAAITISKPSGVLKPEDLTDRIAILLISAGAMYSNVPVPSYDYVVAGIEDAGLNVEYQRYGYVNEVTCLHIGPDEVIHIREADNQDGSPGIVVETIVDESRDAYRGSHVGNIRSSISKSIGGGFDRHAGRSRRRDSRNARRESRSTERDRRHGSFRKTDVWAATGDRSIPEKRHPLDHLTENEALRDVLNVLIAHDIDVRALVNSGDINAAITIKTAIDRFQRLGRLVEIEPTESTFFNDINKVAKSTYGEILAFVKNEHVPFKYRFHIASLMLEIVDEVTASVHQAQRVALFHKALCENAHAVQVEHQKIQRQVDAPLELDWTHEFLMIHS